MFDHVTVQVADVVSSREFYARLLSPLGIRPEYTDGDAVGFIGTETGSFWICPAQAPEARELHLAFSAPDQDAVRAFCAAAREAGMEVIYEPQLFRSTTTPTSPPSFATPTATASKPFATSPTPDDVCPAGSRPQIWRIVGVCRVEAASRGDGLLTCRLVVGEGPILSSVTLRSVSRAERTFADRPAGHPLRAPDQAPWCSLGRFSLVRAQIRTGPPERVGRSHPRVGGRSTGLPSSPRRGPERRGRRGRA
jgi:catechol 2,3-dioxygenase-like lactoylglutathione lyase family enzyme